MKLTSQNISKALGGRDIFTDFSLEVESGMRLCVCGSNGTGKSTLIRMLADAESPDSGRVLVPREARVGYVAQELDEATLDKPLLSWVLEVLPDWSEFWSQWENAAGDKDEAALRALSARQAELEARHGYHPEHRARAVLSGLGFSEKKLGRPLRQLSGGWRERAKLARVLTAGADILLLDEPTNHLDLDAVEWLENFLLEYQGALVFVAHDRVFMDRVSTHVLYLGGSRPLFRKGNFSRFLELQETVEEQRERDAKRIAGEIERKMDFVRRFKAKATKARQAASRQRMAKRLEKELETLQPEARRKDLSFRWPEAARADKVVVSAVDLGYSFPDGKTQFHNLDFQLYRGQKIALVGPNGCGKTTLLKVLAGKLERTHGSVVFGPLTRMGFFSQHQMEILSPRGTVLGEIRRLSDPKLTEEELMSALGLFLLGQDFFEREAASLSGGEKSRLLLATLFLSRSNFLMLDEPTNHLDLESRETLVDALSEFNGTVLMVAHDRHLLSAVADEIWAMGENGLTVYEGGYPEYDAARKAQRSENSLPLSGAAPGTASGATSAPSLTREDVKRLRREKAEQRNALSRRMRPHQEAFTAKEKELEALMNEQAETESLLANPDVYADSAKAAELMKRYHAIQARYDELFAEMERLEAVLAEFEEEKKALGSED